MNKTDVFNLIDETCVLCYTASITIHKYSTMRDFISVVTMPFLIEHKSHFSWQLMPTVWGMQWKPLSHAHITVMMLQWFNDDNWYHSSKAVCSYRSHCFDCYKDNSKQHWDSCCAEMTNVSFTEQRQPLHPSNDSEF